MRILLVGRSGGITHWLEDAAAAFRAGGHAVAVAFTRRPWLNVRLEHALAGPLAGAIMSRARRFAPDLILVIGGFHAPALLLERLAALPGRPPLAGWVGDLFPPSADAAARLYDLIAYTDSGLMARHVELGFASRAVFLPHAVNPAATPAPARRASRMVLVASATAGRRRVVEAITAPMTVHGPGWSRDAAGERHEIHPGTDATPGRRRALCPPPRHAQYPQRGQCSARAEPAELRSLPGRHAG